MSAPSRATNARTPVCSSVRSASTRRSGAGAVGAAGQGLESSPEPEGAGRVCLTPLPGLADEQAELLNRLRHLLPGSRDPRSADARDERGPAPPARPRPGQCGSGLAMSAEPRSTRALRRNSSGAGGSG